MSTSVEMQDVAGGGRICFRGDDREPSALFKLGFFSRKPASTIKYTDANPAPLLIRPEHASEYQRHGFKTTVGKTFDPSGMTPSEIYAKTLDGKSPQGMSIAIVPRTPDIDSHSAVCVTPRFAMAVLFPPKQNPSDRQEYTWVYAVFVRRLFNTHAQQACDGLKAIENEFAARSAASRTALGPYGGAAVRDAYVDSVALWPLYAQELATKVVAPTDVICAIRVRRAWKGKDFTYGCDYELLKKSLKFNRLCTVDKPQVKAVKAFLKSEPVHGTTPSRTTGFHKDDENTRFSIATAKLAAKVDEMMKGRSVATVEDSDMSDSEWL